MSSRSVLKSGRRRARRKGAPVEWFTAGDLLLWWLKAGIDHSKCFWCGGPQESTDHVVPIALYGPHSLDNIVPCCHYCNNRKDSMSPWRWIAELVDEI